MEMTKSDLEVLEKLVDAYGIAEVLSGLSYVCSDKAEAAAVKYQSTTLAKNWMRLSSRLDKASATIEK